MVCVGILALEMEFEVGDGGPILRVEFRIQHRGRRAEIAPGADALVFESLRHLDPGRA